MLDVHDAFSPLRFSLFSDKITLSAARSVFPMSLKTALSTTLCFPSILGEHSLSAVACCTITPNLKCAPGGQRGGLGETSFGGEKVKKRLGGGEIHWPWHLWPLVHSKPS